MVIKQYLQHPKHGIVCVTSMMQPEWNPRWRMVIENQDIVHFGVNMHLVHT